MTASRRAAAIGRRLVVAIAVLPLLVLVPRSFADAWRAPAIVPQAWGLRGWRVALSSGNDAIGALGVSLTVATLTTMLALLLGWPAARTLARDGLRRHPVTVAVLAAPLLVSPFATGTGLAEWFLRFGLADTVTGLVLAHLVPVLPYVVLTLVPAFGAGLLDREEAARTLGATEPMILRTVTIPGVAPTLSAAALLGFLVSFSQYGTSLAVGGGLPTLPIVLLPFIGRDAAVAAALSVVFIAPVLIALVASIRADDGWRG